MISAVRFTLIALFSIFAITLAIIYRLISGSPKTPVWWAHSWWGPGTLKIAGVKLQVEGLENVDFSKPYVFVCNHQSFIDIPCVFTALPTRLHFVAKEELKKFPFLGQYMTAMGMIFINRTSISKALESLKKAGELIKKGKNVIAFPEGTRTKTGEIGSFKKGPILLAAQAGVKIIPIKIDGARSVWPQEKVKLTPGIITIKIGHPIDTKEINKENAAHYCKTIQAAVVNL